MPINLSEEQQLRIIMTFGFDQAKAQQVIAGLRTVSSSTKEMVDSIQKTRGISLQVAEQMTSAMKSTVNMQQAFNREIRLGHQYTQQEIQDFERLGVVTDQLARKVSGQGGGLTRGMGPGFAEFMVAMSLRSLPGMQGSPVAEGIMGASSLNSAISMFQGIAKEAGSMSAALGLVLKSLGPVTIAFTAITTVMSILNTEYEKNAKAVKESTDRLKEFYTLVQTETSDSIERQIAAEQVKKNAFDKTAADTVKDIQNLIPEAIASRNKARAGVGMAPVDLTKPEDRAALVMDVDLSKLGQYQNLSASLGDLQTESDKSAARIKMLNDVMGNLDVAANDAAVALLKEADHKNKIEKQIAADYAMTSDQATKRISTLLEDEAAQQRNIDAYTKAMNTVEKGTPQYLEYKAGLDAANQALADDQAEVKNLTDVILPLIREREAEAEAAKLTAKILDELRSELTKTADDIEKTKQSLADLEQSYAESQEAAAKAAIVEAERARITKEWQDRIDAAKEAERMADAEAKLAKARKDAQADIDKIYADLRDKILEAERDFAIQMFREAEDFYIEDLRRHADYLTERRRTEQDARDQMAQDAADRNVVAWIRDREEARKKLQRQAEDFATEDSRAHQDYDRRRQREMEDFARRLQDMRDAADKEAAQRRAASARQLAEDQAAIVKRETESQRLQQMFDNLKRQWQIQDQASKEASEFQSYIRRRTALEVHLRDMEATFANYYFRIQAMMSGAQTGNNQPGYAPANNPFQNPYGGAMNSFSNSGNTTNWNLNVSSGVNPNMLMGALNQLANDFANAVKRIA